MRLTAQVLNRTTLHRQALLARRHVAVEAAVHDAFAIQAQEPASPYLALWNRVDGFDAAELDRAFAERRIVKATLMRATLHAVTAADHPLLHAAMLPRLREARLPDRRFAALGITAAEADAALADLLGHLAEPRSNAEIEAVLTERFGALPEPGLWWALRTYGPVQHAVTDAPWGFGPRPCYVAAPPAEPVEHADAVRHYVSRYLAAFGPATAKDLAQFSLLRMPWIRDAIASLELDEHSGPAGERLVDVPGGELADAPAPPRLLGMWDSVLLAYADRARVIPPEYRRHVIRSNGDTLPTVLVDGHVAGSWRATPDGIEIGAFRPLAPDAWRALTAEAEALRAFVADRDPEVYRRYRRWWASLPVVESRVL